VVNDANNYAMKLKQQEEDRNDAKKYDGLDEEAMV
jgi:hypothetical protein